MGCDIHFFIEYKHKDSKSWFDFGSEFRLDRDYLMFGILSKGVRTTPSFSYDGRGVPSDVSWKIKDAWVMYVGDNDESDGYIPKERALKYANEYKCKAEYDADGNIEWVENPDWHSHNWLTVDEFENAIEFYKKQGLWEPLEYVAVLAAMKELANSKDVRCVFWFDN